MVLAVALLLAVQVVRNAAVNALAPLYPAEAAKFWAAHPFVEISLGLTQIGAAARDRRGVAGPVFAMIDDAARKAPLATEPFLVRGVQAQMANDATAAERAFAAAQWRDPRSMPAAYFLADYYFREGQPLKGLQETALLARLSPQGVDTVAPFVAAYAQNRANWPQIRVLFRDQEGLENSVLEALARNAGNADAVLALAGPGHRQADSRWLPILLDSLVSSGEYPRARAIWASVGAAGPTSDLVYDSSFEDSSAPPPFNWTLASSTVGLAEREPGRKLHVIFYGNEDGVLAGQLLLLPAGTYRMQLHLVGSPANAGALRWSIRCDKWTEAVGAAPIDQVARSGWTFSIPANCPAQWLELSGRTGDVAQQSDVTIGGFALTRAAPSA